MNIKNKIIDITSDVMSYPARRRAQKSIAQSNADVRDLKMVREAKGVDTSDKDYTNPLFRARANVEKIKFEAQQKALKSLK